MLGSPTTDATLTPDVAVDDEAPRIMGSAAEPWPVEGCRCLACLGCLAARGTSHRATALRWGSVYLADGVITKTGNGRTNPEVTALPGCAADQPVFMIETPHDRLLWAATPGALPVEALDVLARNPVAAAVLDVRAPGGSADPLNLAHNVARLRAAGALRGGCDVIAVGLSHQADPVRLAGRLAEWGARTALDGTAVSLTGIDRVTPPWRQLFLGAAASGKSAAAESVFAAEPQVVYAATGPTPEPDDGNDGDADWSTRVAAHRARRPAWWITVENPDLPALLAEPGAPLVIDSLGTWMTAALQRTGAWDDAPRWQDRLDQEVDDVVSAWRHSSRPVVAVAEEVGWSVVPATSAGRLFRDALGTFSQRLAGETERVVLVVAGTRLEISANHTAPGGREHG